MPLSAAAFCLRFPEFSATPTAQVSTAITAAEARADVTIPEPTRTELVAYDAADQLASTTAGRNARRARNAAGERGSIYAERLRSLRALAIGGIRTSGV